MPCSNNSSLSTSALISLSSATSRQRSASLFSPEIAGDTIVFAVFPLLSSNAILYSSSTLNAVPSRSRLSTYSLPPISSISPFVMLSPSPLPSTRCVFRFRVKGSNRWDKNDSGIPIPVSRIVKQYRTYSVPLAGGISSVKNVTVPPSGVNLTAFPRMLINIWLIRRASP